MFLPSKWFPTMFCPVRFDFLDPHRPMKGFPPLVLTSCAGGRWRSSKPINGIGAARKFLPSNPSTTETSVKQCANTKTTASLRA